MVKKIILIVFTVSIYSQPMEYKTDCKDQQCTIRAFNAESLAIGFLHLNGCHINYIQVIKEHEKKGVGKALLQQARAQAEAHGCKEITLYSFKSLFSFYQHNGFICDTNRNCTHPV